MNEKLRIGDKVRPKHGSKTRLVTEVSKAYNFFKWGNYNSWHDFDSGEWVLMPPDAVIDHTLTRG